MKFVPIRELRNKAGKVWGDLRREHELVLTSNGRPIAIVTEVSGDDLERQLKAVRRARAALALERMRQSAVETGISGMTSSEIDREIIETRKARAARAGRGGARRKKG